jgi:HSP20 family molecular chaperone IbpA
VQARHENGVLTIVLPKAETSRPRRIQIEGAATARALNE